MSTKTMNQVIANYFKTQEDCTFGINIGGKEYDNKQSIYFKSFRLDPFTVDWSDEIGFAPRYLYERGKAA